MTAWWCLLVEQSQKAEQSNDAAFLRDDAAAAVAAAAEIDIVAETLDIVCTSTVAPIFAYHSNLAADWGGAVVLRNFGSSLSVFDSQEYQYHL